MIFRRLARVFAFFLPLVMGVLLSHAQAPLGEIYSSDATVKGAIELTTTGTRLMSGSSVTAGSSNARVRLQRGGELRVCQGSSVSLTSSPDGGQIMVGLSAGTVEAHYPLGNIRDSVMTPDFQISLNGPAIFHLALSTDKNGNTCVQSLHGNKGSVTVSELMGNGSYTVLPGEEWIFRAGQASAPGPVVGNCGCPAAVPVQRAAVQDEPKPTAAAVPAPVPAAVAEMIASSPKSVTAPPPAAPADSVHVQVEAPFVFRASDPRPPRDAPVDLAEIRVSTQPVLPALYGQPPPEELAQSAPDTEKPKKKKKHGVWGFLASIFKG